MATPISVSLGFMAWLQEVWSGFAAGSVYTGDVTQPDSTARTIPPVTQAVNLCGTSRLMKNPFRVAMHSSLWDFLSMTDSAINSNFSTMTFRRCE
jgi:hypothetical protein